MPSYTVIPQQSLEKTESQAILKYIRSISVTNKRTANEYLGRLLVFEAFIKENYDFSVDELTINKTFSVDIYDLLSNYVSWLNNRTDKDGSKLLSNVSIKNRVINVKNFLEYFDIPVNPHKFKLRVKLPRVFNQYKEALTKEDIVKILNVCPSIKLKTYLICLAVTGCRASEMCSVRLKDIDWENSKINLRAEYTKTKVGRYCYITYECKDFLQKWIEYKYRRRRLYLNNIGNRWVKPNSRGEDLVFSTSFTYDGSVISASQKQKNIDELDIIGNLYTTIVIEFNKLIKGLGIGYEGNSKHRHIFTLHSFRRYVRTLISDLGYQDFAEWTLGHSYSTYWRKGDKEKYELFKKIEPYLTYLDQSGLERKGADIKTKMDTFEKENKLLREEQKMKDDRLAIVEEQFSIMQSQMQSLLSSLGSMQDQNQVNQMAKTLYNSKILKTSSLKDNDN
jgi:integrase